MSFNGAMTNDLHSCDCPCDYPHSLDIQLSKMSKDAINHSLVFFCVLFIVGGEGCYWRQALLVEEQNEEGAIL